jgi:predicted transcriptional regulator
MEHLMTKERRHKLMHIYKQSQELSNWLWMGILSGDEEKVRQDIEWAKQISLQISEGLLGYSGIEKNAMAKSLQALQSSQHRRGGMADTDSWDAALGLVSRIVTAYVANNIIPTSELPGLIRSVHNAHPHTKERPPQPRQPAVPIGKSVQPNYIVCLEDGKKLKTLKRHLKITHGLSAQEYRKKWGLPEDYPMVAPTSAKRRSALAKKIGLGKTSGGRPKTRKQAASETQPYG